MSKHAIMMTRENMKLLSHILAATTDFKKMSDDEIKFLGELLHDIVAYLQKTHE